MIRTSNVITLWLQVTSILDPQNEFSPASGNMSTKEENWYGNGITMATITKKAKVRRFSNQLVLVTHSVCYFFVPLLAQLFWQ